MNTTSQRHEDPIRLLELFSCKSSFLLKTFKVLSESYMENGSHFYDFSFLSKIWLLLTITLNFSVEVSRCTVIKHIQKMEKMNDLYIYMKYVLSFPLNGSNFWDMLHWLSCISHYTVLYVSLHCVITSWYCSLYGDRESVM